jgi:hypothetical protein
MVRHLHALPQTLTSPLEFFKAFQNLTPIEEKRLSVK